MKRILALIMGLGVISLGLVGCGDTAATKTETKVSTPGGSTTVTTEKEVKKTGDNPPATRP
jgi:ABC-type glycerol-3-phosphate transport system substrate-binding protein